MKKYVIYARIASRKQADRNSSIISQVEILKELAQTIGVEVVDIFTEVSSANKPRKKFNQMLEDLNVGHADGILCLSLDRLCRCSHDIEKIIKLINERNIQVITPEEVYKRESDKLFLMSLIYAMEEYSRAMQSQKIKLGKRKEVENENNN